MLLTLHFWCRHSVRLTEHIQAPQRFRHDMMVLLHRVTINCNCTQDISVYCVKDAHAARVEKSATMSYVGIFSLFKR